MNYIFPLWNFAFTAVKEHHQWQQIFTAMQVFMQQYTIRELNTNQWNVINLDFCLVIWRDPGTIVLLCMSLCLNRTLSIFRLCSIQRSRHLPPFFIPLIYSMLPHALLIPHVANPIFAFIPPVIVNVSWLRTCFIWSSKSPYNLNLWLPKGHNILSSTLSKFWEKTGPDYSLVDRFPLNETFLGLWVNYRPYILYVQSIFICVTNDLSC